MDDDQPDREPLGGGRAERLARDRARDAACVARVRAGDAAAFTELYDAWFPRVFGVARRIVGNDAIAEEVAQDAVTTAWHRLDTLADPASFGGWVLRITRNRALDRAGREQRSAPVDADGLAVIEASSARTPGSPGGIGVEDRLGATADPARVAEDNEVVALLWEAASALGERDTTVLDLQLRHGLGPVEIGEVLGLNRNAANQLVHRVKGRLRGAVQARLLWRGGAPRCPDLAATLDRAGVVAFGREVVAIVERHVPGCDDCGDRGRTAVAPAALFAAIPSTLPPGARDRVAAALHEAGVPVGPALEPASGPHSPGPGDGGRGGGGGAGTTTSRTGVLVGALVVLLLLAGVVAAGLLPGDAPEDGVDTGAADVREGPGGSAGEPTGSTPGDSGGGAPPATVATGEPGSTVGSGDAAPSADPGPGGGGTTTVPSTTLPPDGPGSGDDPLDLPPTPAPAPPAAPPDAVASPPTTDPVPAPVISFTLAPGPARVTGWSVVGASGAEPHLTWAVTGAERIVIRGHETDASLPRPPSGRLDICPVVPTSDSFCNAPSGTYTYELVVLGLDGSLTSRTVALTVADPVPG